MPAQARPRGWSYKPGTSIIRGYDSSPLFRDDCLERIKHLQMELDANMKRIKQAEKEYAAAEEQLRKRKKEFGWID